MTPLVPEALASAPDRVLAMQRTAGNQATARLLRAVLARSALSEQLTKLASDPKGKVFDALRARKPPGPDADALAVIRARFGTEPDDCWLAERLLEHGPEPLWPDAVLKERAKRSQQGKWAPEAGNIAADLPYPAESDTLPPPVHAFFFPGVTDRRALIIGGVHGSEPQGVAVVESLRTELAKRSAAGKPPYFTVILVPELIARTHQSKLPKVKDRRYVPRAPGDTAETINKTGIEPNRTFPTPGEDYADARKRATAGDSELKFDPPGKEGPRPPKSDHSTSTILPENRVLIQLIERFKPERIASVHAHFLDPGRPAKPAAKGKPEVPGRDPRTGRPGNDPGVFVDPRHGTAAEIAEDDRLATDMLHHAQKRAPAALQGGERDPFMGNVGGKKHFKETVHYDPAAGDTEGYSLGDWAPVATPTRGAITTVTIEIPQPTDDLAGKDVEAVQEAHRDALLEIFLGPPPSASPSPSP